MTTRSDRPEEVVADRQASSWPMIEYRVIQVKRALAAEDGEATFAETVALADEVGLFLGSLRRPTGKRWSNHLARRMNIAATASPTGRI